MKFSTKTTYGLRAMILLALNIREKSLSLASIAKKENISQGYLEKIFACLKKEKLVKAAKGVKGGYRLASPPKKINIFKIVEALEGEHRPFYCLGKSGKKYCGPDCNCEVSLLFARIQKAITETLRNVRLSDLIKKA
jgi:Rrf2 family protein